MAWKVTVTPEVARLRSGDAGTRNVRVGGVLYTFNRNPTFMDELPDAVSNDPHLVVVEAKADEKAAPPKPPPATEPEMVEAGDEGVEVVAAPAAAPAAAPPAKPAARRGRPPKASAKK